MNQEVVRSAILQRLRALEEGSLHEAFPGLEKGARVDEAERLWALLALRIARGKGSLAAALTVDRDAAWFELPDGTRVSLDKRQNLRRVLALLVRERFLSPEGPVKAYALFESGWPGDSIAESSAIDRVYQAVRTLRRFGLRDYIVSSAEGYSLSVALPIVVVAQKS